MKTLQTRLQRQGKEYLLSRIKVRIELTKSLLEVERLMSNYFGIIQVARGSTLKYVMQDENIERFYEIEISENELCFSIFSSSSPVYYFSEALPLLINFIFALPCKFEAKDLLPYLAYTIKSQQISKSLSESHEKESRDIDFLLSKRIIQLKNEIAGLKNENIVLKQNLERARALLVVAYAYPNASIEELEKATGMSKEELKLTFLSLPSLGYKVLMKGNNRVEVIRL